MKKRIWKSVVSLALALSLILGYGNVITLASEADGKEAYQEGEGVRTGYLAGGDVRGDLTVNNMYALATTTYGRGGGYIYATAIIYYWWGTADYKTTVGPVMNSAGGVSARAEKQLGGADVLGAQGSHEVKWQAYGWTPNDTILGIAKTDPERAAAAIEYVE